MVSHPNWHCLASSNSTWTTSEFFPAKNFKWTHSVHNSKFCSEFHIFSLLCQYVVASCFLFCFFSKLLPQLLEEKKNQFQHWSSASDFIFPCEHDSLSIDHYFQGLCQHWLDSPLNAAIFPLLLHVAVHSAWFSVLSKRGEELDCLSSVFFFIYFFFKWEIIFKKLS